MKNGFWKYLPVWIILFALFNVLAWVPPFERNELFYTVYGLSTGAFVLQLLIVLLAFRNKNKTVSYPIFIYSIVGLAMLFVADFYFVYYCFKYQVHIESWMFIVVDAFILALHYVFLIAMSASLKKNVERDEHYNEKTDTMRTLIKEVKALYDDTNNNDIYKLYETLRYSNKGTKDLEIEKKMKDEIDQLSCIIDDNIIKEKVNKIINMNNRR